MKRIIFFLLPFALSCTSTAKFSVVWQTDSGLPKPCCNKILVLGLMPKSLNLLSQQMEDQVTAKLSAQGYPAIAANKAYGKDYFKEMNSGTAIALLRQDGVDAVVTIVADKEVNFELPAEYRPRKDGPIYDSIYNIFADYRTVFQPHYRMRFFSTEDKYYLECDVYDMNNKRLMYATKSETVDRKKLENKGSTYAKKIVAQMVERSVFNRRNAVAQR